MHYKLVSLRHGKHCFILFFMLLIVGTTHAQVSAITTDSTSYASSADTLQQVVATDLEEQSKPSPVLKHAAFIVAGVGIWTASFAWVDEPVQRYMYTHSSVVGNEISAVVEPLGRQHYMVPLAATAAVAGMLIKDKKLEKAGLLATGSIMVSAGVTEVLKHQFHRHRPNSGNDNHFFDGPSQSTAHTSLPSSHTTTAFAVATSVASVYKYDHPIVPPIAYGVATLVGLSRINDNAHWTTDVLAGALVGYLSAKGTLYIYDMVDQKLKLRKQELLITPQPGLRTGGVRALLIF